MFSNSYRIIATALLALLLSLTTAAPLPNAEAPDYSKNPDSGAWFPTWDFSMPDPVWTGGNYYICKESWTMSPKAWNDPKYHDHPERLPIREDC